MAHRLVWKSRYDDTVMIYERGEKLKGRWTVDAVMANRIKVRGTDQIRSYLVREWVTTLECRVTLESIVFAVAKEKQDGKM